MQGGDPGSSAMSISNSGNSSGADTNLSVLPDGFNKRKQRRSYNCGPCRKQKIKCDLNFPCGSCVRHRRQKECEASPPNPPSPRMVAARDRRKTSAQWKKFNSSLQERAAQAGPTSVSPVQSYYNNSNQVQPNSVYPDSYTSHIPLPVQHPHLGHPQAHMSAQQPQLHHLHLQQQQQIPAQQRLQPPQMLIQPLQNGPRHLAHSPQPDTNNGIFTAAPQGGATPPVFLANGHQVKKERFTTPAAPSFASFRNTPVQETPDGVLKKFEDTGVQYHHTGDNLQEAAAFQPAVPIPETLTVSTNGTSQLKVAPGLNIPTSELFPAADDQAAAIKSAPKVIPPFTLVNAYKNAELLRDAKRVIILNLPPKQIVEKLIFHYLEQVNHQHDILNRYLVTTTLNNFWVNSQKQNFDNISFALFSLIFAVLSVSVLVMTKPVATSLDLDSYYQSQFGKPLSVKDLAEHFFGLYTICYMNSSQLLKYDEPVDSMSIVQKEEIDLLRLQAFCVAKLYYYVTKQFETAYNALSNSISCSYGLGLHHHRVDLDDLFRVDDPIIRRALLEERRKIWWELCYTDTYFGLLFDKQPIIRSCYSKVLFPARENQLNNTESNFHIIRYRVMKILNGLFEIPELHMLSSDNSVARHIKILAQIIDIDKQLCAIEISEFLQAATIEATGSKATRQAAKMIQSFIIHSTVCITRFKLYQGYLHLNLPSFNSICISSIKSMYRYYRLFRLKYPPELFPSFYITLLPEIHASMVVVFIFLFHTTGCLSKEDKSMIYEDITKFRADIKILNELYENPQAIKSADVMISTLDHLLMMKERKCSVEELLESFRDFLATSEYLVVPEANADPAKKKEATSYVNNYVKQFYLDFVKLNAPFKFDVDLVSFFNSEIGVTLPDELIEQELKAAETKMYEVNFPEIATTALKRDSLAFASTYGIVYCILGYGVPRAS